MCPLCICMDSICITSCVCRPCWTTWKATPTASLRTSWWRSSRRLQRTTATKWCGQWRYVLPSIQQHSSCNQVAVEESSRVTWQGAGTKESVLIEIFASRTNEQIRALNEAYLQGEVTRRPWWLSKVKWAKIVCRMTHCPHCHLWAEREKKLTFDLKKEVSGDFSKALLLLAEVCLSCTTHMQG